VVNYEEQPCSGNGWKTSDRAAVIEIE
jgi:hypothetical protein